MNKSMRIAFVAVLSVIFAGLIGYNFASANISERVLAEQKDSASLSSISFDEEVSSAAYDNSSLKNPTERDITSGIAFVEEEQQREAEARKAAEKEAAERAEQARIEQQAAAAQEGASQSLSELELVDWTVGHDAFVSEWTNRIDAYLAGSPLAGYGATFAEAAWQNGVDPRWSPAISNTESSKGAICFSSHNAWGWGNSAWSNWDEAIYAHVAGLASGYGYSITMNGARKYCPPNSDNWFNNTLSEMKRI